VTVKRTKSTANGQRQNEENEVSFLCLKVAKFLPKKDEEEEYDGQSGRRRQDDQ
jgi:hypothetical protein